MDRKQRLDCRKNQTTIRLNKAAETIDRALDRAGIPSSDKSRFLDWAIRSSWETFKAERMNQRIMIENEIRQLGLRFPNGTVNKDYSILFDLPTDRISILGLQGAEELGLRFTVGDNGRCSLAGKPTQAGDFTLRLRYRTVEGEPDSELAIPIAFNPDPRTLWRDIPTDTEIPYYKPDSETEYIKIEEDNGISKKDMVAASRRGRSHAQEGKARDDHFAMYHCDKSDWYIMAVADGAGSAKYSRKGSEVACRTVIDHCRNLLLDNPEFETAIRNFEPDRENADKRAILLQHISDIVYRGAVKAHEAVKKCAEANSDSRVKDFATTLMFAICKKFNFGWFVSSFWVGDGAMGILDTQNKSIKLLGTPDEGEYSGQTRFLTMPEIFRDNDIWAKRLRVSFVEDFTALFLMTDGVSDPMFETDRNLNDYSKWEEFFDRLRQGFPDDDIPGVNLTDDNENSKNELLRWLDFWSPGNHDDRTIAVLY